MASDFVGDDEEAHGQQLDLDEAPDFLLESYGLLEFFLLSERGNLDHGLCSSDLACCQRDSISAMVESAGVAPRSASLCSTCAKRRRNLALVRRSACSGSTFTNRARFTSTKSRSPSSSSSCSRDSERRAASNSANSSRSFSTPPPGALPS